MLARGFLMICHHDHLCKDRYQPLLAKWSLTTNNILFSTGQMLAQKRVRLFVPAIVSQHTFLNESEKISVAATSHQIGAKISWILLGLFFCFRFCFNRTITFPHKNKVFQTTPSKTLVCLNHNQMASPKCMLLYAFPMIPTSSPGEG